MEIVSKDNTALVQEADALTPLGARDGVWGYIHSLPSGTEQIPSPLHFTYPFYYEPHPLCVAAVEEIKPLCRKLLEGEKGGKMFGVLVVEGLRTTDNGQRTMDNGQRTTDDGQRTRGYLAAFSGTIQGTYHHPGFVPPIFDLMHPGCYFQEEQAAISDINRRIKNGETDPALFEERKTRSQNLQWWLFQQFHILNARHEYKDLPELFKDEKPILSTDEYFGSKTSRLSAVSNSLPLREGRGGSLLREGRGGSSGAPIPSGSGECCAPKLLQYAYSHGLKPLCMAEFWLGPSPKDEPRIDGNYYPACHSKCKPILRHMLQGLDVEENPVLKKNREMVAHVEYIYEDRDIAVLYKPSGLLSAPGKDDVPSLLDIVRQKYPEAMYAHRLDMDTSGLIVFGLNAQSHKRLQEEFIKHEVRKHYIAILDGETDADLPRTGTISLPLLPNPFDRPRQMVNHEHGKQAITHYEILSVGNGQTRIKFNPQTGRTHQLRVHSASPEGLGIPIKGDNLYGTPADRLYLHAEELSFYHPTTNEWMTFKKEEL